MEEPLPPLRRVHGSHRLPVIARTASRCVRSNRLAGHRVRRKPATLSSRKGARDCLYGGRWERPRSSPPPGPAGRPCPGRRGGRRGVLKLLNHLDAFGPKPVKPSIGRVELPGVADEREVFSSNEISFDDIRVGGVGE